MTQLAISLTKNYWCASCICPIRLIISQRPLGVGWFKEMSVIISPGIYTQRLILRCSNQCSQYCGSLCNREVACSASDRQDSNFESCVWRTVSSQSSHHPQEVLLAQSSLYVHKGGLKPDLFHFQPVYIGSL